MAVPTKDSLLLNWSTNFNTRCVAAPITFGLTATQMTAYTPLHTAFVTAYNAANIVGARSKSLVSAKDDAKAALLVYARELYGFVQANNTVSDANKDLIGVTVKARPTPTPPPDTPPALDIVSVVGRTVRVRLHDASGEGNRRKPRYVKGAMVVSFVGAVPPVDTSAWIAEGTTTASELDVEFDSALAPGATVWLSAAWLGNKLDMGPACSPVSVTFGAASASAA